MLWWLSVIVFGLTSQLTECASGQASVVVGPDGNIADSLQSSDREAFNIRYEIVDGVETIWTKTLEKPVGTAVLLHGCNHGATDWFDRSEFCPTCGFGSEGWGLPEEKAVVRYAQSRDLAVVVLSSDDRDGSKCWNPRVDATKVSNALDSLLSRPGNEALNEGPLYVFGASSGGSFAALFPVFLRRRDGTPFNIGGIAVQISSGGGLLKSIQTGRLVVDAIPPVALLHMPRDQRTAKGVDALQQKLVALGSAVKVVALRPLTVNAQFFSTRVEEVRWYYHHSLFIGCNCE